jgi:arylsulfatase
MSDRPDLVLFMTDQQRFDQVGYASGGHFETPNLDALASRGVVFDNAYSASTNCVPARSSLLTGLQHHRLPRQVNHLALEEGFWTVAHALHASGYETALVGKMHFFPVRARHGFETSRMCEDLSAQAGYTADDVDDYHSWLGERGLADWRGVFQAHDTAGRQRHATDASGGFPYDAATHPTGWIEAEACSMLERRDRTRPLLLIVSFPNPHAPYNPAEPYASMYDPVDAVVPSDGFEVNEQLPPTWVRAMDRLSRSRVDGERGVRRILTSVRAMVRHIDDAMGRIVGQLDMARSVVFFTSDHGDYGGHRGLLKKTPWVPFDDLARVPLVVAGAGVAGGRRCAEVVQSSDFALTCLDRAGVDPPADVFDSRTLQPLLAGDAGQEATDRAVFCATSVGFPMVRRGPLKYLVNGRTGEPLLIDLSRDPGETRSVLGEPAYRTEAAELAALLDAELARGIPDLPSFG